MIETIEIPIVRLPHAPDLPVYKTHGAVGMDIQAAIDEPVTLHSLERALIPTGFKIALPEGYEAQLRARSGLSTKHGITLINGVGTIDWDYRDEIKIGLVNLSKEAYTIQPGERIAQMLIQSMIQVRWRPVTDVEPVLASGRYGGFGSTGK